MIAFDSFKSCSLLSEDICIELMAPLLPRGKLAVSSVTRWLKPSFEFIDEAF